MMDTDTIQSIEHDVAGSQANLSIKHNPYAINLENLFSLAIRDNTKRKLLFVSKVLGKHIPVYPFVSLSCGMLMAAEFAKTQYNVDIDSDYKKNLVSCLDGKPDSYEVFQTIKDTKISLPESPIFIGFAETATALGHSVFSSFSSDSYFIHTTRENFDNIEPLLNFDEEHSHAVMHKLFPQSREIFMQDAPIVLVDDEITTGKSSLNLIENLHKLHPHKSYTILSILDWRNNKDKELFTQYEKNLNTKINVVSLVSGDLSFEYHQRKIGDNFINSQSEDTSTTDNTGIVFNRVYFNDFDKFPKSSDDMPFLNYTGRFGIDRKDYNEAQKSIAYSSHTLKDMRNSYQSLCLGTGEFMYIPMIISSLMGRGIYFHSTTRSPIHARSRDSEYAIHNAYHFKDFYDNETDYYLYNIPINSYEEAFIFFERDIDNNQFGKIKTLFAKTTIKRVNIVVFSRNKTTT